ncbi:toll/interleukin-1 receptor domain-containing protein [Mesorhizobium escarrei]|uniref:TIR domain-containing protein n=1 Tax=Mesorhizobium escarrei TaxID=666018 RepID=A0ABM9E216_9HYPH|nr:toll/interleukin-1 receptor domain-containing protein [Mesorhizobium escarrei]CAH2403126.1 hypothetical protein MES5069_360168 [Mesorhizobium escarrei]
MSEIFISWSNTRSRLFADALRQLMTSVIHDPDWTPPPPLGPGSHVVSMSADLPKGGSWFSHLAGLLENARAGIICVTPENYASPWLLFEAGALIRCDREVALFPVLFDLPATSLDGPLALVQGTVIERDAHAIKREVLDLLNQVVAHVNTFPDAPNRLMVDQPAVNAPAPPDAANRLMVDQPAAVNAPASLPVVDPEAVADPWKTFATTVLQLELPSTVSIFDRFPQLFERKTFQEPFHDCADQRWLDRYAGACIARDAMEKQRSRIATALPPGAQLAYDRLSAAVDSYAMAIAGQLLEEHRFGTDHQGRLNDVDGRLAVCERRREAIRAAYMRLRDPVPPVFDDARIYEELTDLEERKIRLIHPLEQQLDSQIAAVGQFSTPEWRLKHAATSPWLYDRLVFFIHAAKAKDLPFPSFEDLLEGLERELSLLEARDTPATVVCLYYALEAIEVRAASTDDRPRVLDLLSRIEARIVDWNRSVDVQAPKERVDANGKIRRLAGRLRTALTTADLAANVAPTG